MMFLVFIFFIISPTFLYNYFFRAFHPSEVAQKNIGITQKIHYLSSGSYVVIGRILPATTTTFYASLYEEDGRLKWTEKFHLPETYFEINEGFGVSICSFDSTFYILLDAEWSHVSNNRRIFTFKFDETGVKWSRIWRGGSSSSFRIGRVACFDKTFALFGEERLSGTESKFFINFYDQDGSVSEYKPFSLLFESGIIMKANCYPDNTCYVIGKLIDYNSCVSTNMCIVVFKVSKHRKMEWIKTYKYSGGNLGLLNVDNENIYGVERLTNNSGAVGSELVYFNHEGKFKYGHKISNGVDGYGLDSTVIKVKNGIVYLSILGIDSTWKGRTQAILRMHPWRTHEAFILSDSLEFENIFFTNMFFDNGYINICGTSRENSTAPNTGFILRIDERFNGCYGFEMVNHAVKIEDFSRNDMAEKILNVELLENEPMPGYIEDFDYTGSNPEFANIIYCEGDPFPIVEVILIASACVSSLFIIFLVISGLFGLLCIYVRVIKKTATSNQKKITGKKVNANKSDYVNGKNGNEMELFEKFSQVKDESFDIFFKKWKSENSNFTKRINLIKYEDLKLIKYIGAGGSGCSIFLAEYTNKDDEVSKVALKSFPVIFEKLESLFTNKSSLYNDFKKELTIYMHVSHPFVLQLHGIVFQAKYVGLVMEFCANGDVKEYVENGKPLSIEEKKVLLFKISSGMAHLHFNNIIHRDLKLNNILVDQLGNPKIMDFGLSKLIVNSVTKTKNIGTESYQAPELVLTGKYDEKVDVFSFAILAFEVLSENFDPFDSKNFEGNITIAISTDENFRPNIKELEKISVDKWLIDIIVKSWNSNPKSRMTFPEICKEFLAKSELGQKERNIFIEKTKKNPIVIYILKEGDKEDSAEDVMLKEFEVEKLKEIGNENFGNVEKVFVKIGDELVELNNANVKTLDNDSIIIYKCKN